MSMWDKEINISLKGYMLMIYEISKILQKPVANFFNDILNSIYPLLKIPLPSISGNNSSSSLSKDNVY